MIHSYIRKLNRNAPYIFGCMIMLLMVGSVIGAILSISA